MRRTAILLLGLSLSGCSTPRDHLPDIAAIYREAALNEARNPVVVIHGILGARLGASKTMQTVWGAFTNDYADPGTPAGARAISLPIDQEPRAATAFDPAREEIMATGPLETLELSFLFNVVSVDVYRNIIRTLGAGGYRDEVVSDGGVQYAKGHFTCHSFWYDWRRDNVENAIQLGRFLRKTRKKIIADARAYVEKLRQRGTTLAQTEADHIAAWLEKGFRFDIVAHSMGGLVARYYLRYGERDLPADGSTPEITWAGAEEVDRLILVATPSLGSIVALEQLTMGYRPSLILPTYDPAVLGSMPSIYQLLPRRRHRVVLDEAAMDAGVDVLDPAVWDQNHWGLLDPAYSETLGWLLPEVDDPAERRRIARRRVAWSLGRARAFHRAMDQRTEKPNPAETFLFAADSEPTLTRTVLRRGSDGRLRPTFGGIEQTFAPGDGTVPRYSALGNERMGQVFLPGEFDTLPFRNVTFLADDHIGLTQNPLFANNLLHILLEQAPPRRK